MLIYHGSNEVVRQPEIRQGDRMLDFGVGFYTTSKKKQAIEWAAQVAGRREIKDQILSVYEFDVEAAERDLSIIRFDEPDGEWLDFVCANRCGHDIPEPYDLVFGPVADDKVYTVVQFYENGVYDKDYAIARLKVDELFDQILFHTERALRYLHFVERKNLGDVK